MNELNLCGNCRYYVPRQAVNIDNDLDGECHRNPPQVIAWPESHELAAFFPAVNKEDWCGKWKQGEHNVPPINEVGMRVW